MGRWRPPTRPGSPYITPEGARALKEELQRLWKSERREVVKALSAAAAEGDRSENAEYTYRKKQLGEIDRRIRYLSKRLDVMKIVDKPPTDRSKVRFGAHVKLLGTSGDEQVFRIVGVDETDARKGWISIDSPLAKALLGKATGVSVTIDSPGGTIEYELLAVEYRPG